MVRWAAMWGEMMDVWYRQENMKGEVFRGGK
jgi:hypothetical protein